MSWSSLHKDVVEVILANLSLVELARVSTTCSTFQALYRKHLAREHDARCSLAVECFGQELITTITGAIIQHFKGEPLDLAFDEYGQWWGAWGDDGTLCVSIEPHWRLHGDVIFVGEHSPSGRWLEVYVPQHRMGLHISVCPHHADDVQLVAMVQAILSGGLAQSIHDAGKWAEIHISQDWQAVAGPDMVSRVGLKAQIGPLMHFATRCISKESLHKDSVTRWVNFTERLQIGEGAPATEQETE